MQILCLADIFKLHRKKEKLKRKRKQVSSQNSTRNRLLLQSMDRHVEVSFNISF